MIQSPSNLELLLHCYYSTGPHPRAEAPAIREGTEYLAKNGMIEKRHDLWRTTEKGEAYIAHLMQVPFPEARWVIPATPNTEGESA